MTHVHFSLFLPRPQGEKKKEICWSFTEAEIQETDRIQARPGKQPFQHQVVKKTKQPWGKVTRKKSGHLDYPLGELSESRVSGHRNNDHGREVSVVKSSFSSFACGVNTLALIITEDSFS